jgi:hypothetical protein
VNRIAGASATNAGGTAGASYGGGGGAGAGAQGAIRIVWPGNARTFPYMAGR